MEQRKAYIKGITTYLPEKRLTNEELAKTYSDWNVEKIYQKTGISERAIAATGETAGDLAFMAAEKLFNNGICKKEEIEFLLLCTQSPDYFLPTTACILQDRLGLPTSCGALDFNLGCSGYIYGLSIAKGLIETGMVRNVVLVTSETYSKYIHPSDRSVRTIFGDGSAATFIASIDSEKDYIGPFVFGTDGARFEQLIVRSGGHRTPFSPKSAEDEPPFDNSYCPDQYLTMDGPEIFNFTLEVVPKTVKELLNKSGKTMDDINMFVFHQANKFMLERLRNKMKIPEGRFCINNEHYGNTVSATIPMALEIEIKKGSLQNDNTVLLVGFGVGLSWGATLVKIFFGRSN